MAREGLGMFDTSPSKGEIRLSIAIVGLQLLIVLSVLPFHDTRIGQVGGFVPAIDAAMCVGEIIIAILIYGQAGIFRSLALTVLASGYLFGALLLIPHALTFPGAFATDGLLGAGVNTTIWLAMLVGLVFPTIVASYALLKSAEAARRSKSERSPARIFRALATTITLATLVTLLATRGHELLPSLYFNHRDGNAINLDTLSSVTIGITLVAMVLLLRQERSVLDVWLLVALAGWLFQLLLTFPVHFRFTVGWYGLFGLQLASSFIIMIASLAETNRLYGRLAVSTAAKERERHARLMSMDAVAAAIAHEIGQPLTAIRLNAAAGLDYLRSEPPKVEKLGQVLDHTQDDVHRAFEVIKSVRTMFSKDGGVRSRFSLNDLTLETAALFSAEISAHKIALELDLDPDLPPIEANPVQIQRILVNLITNSIESLKGTRRRARTIAIRTAREDNAAVLLEITDSGAGILPDKLPQIFEPFITTKKTGTGLGLYLCRTIVEEHSGRLWASAGEAHGVTFHLRLPSGSRPMQSL